MLFNKKLKLLIQYLAPQHALSRLAGWIAKCRWRWFKNILINYFINRYQVDIHIAKLENIDDYPTFNSFFTRHLKSELRPLVQGSNQIASPVDGCISQIGDIQKEALFQAKGFYYSLNSLLGGTETHTQTFNNGQFSTLYLAPKDYHRVHMPLTGRLLETIYIPGKLFSVNQQTTLMVPNLFSRNERLVCIFETATGPMAIILVGAMLVGSIQTVWPLGELNTKEITKKQYSDTIELEKGAELGFFQMGSTVILLFPKNTAEWSTHLKENSTVRMGELLGSLNL